MVFLAEFMNKVALCKILFLAVPAHESQTFCLLPQIFFGVLVSHCKIDQLWLQYLASPHSLSFFHMMIIEISNSNGPSVYTHTHMRTHTHNQSHATCISIVLCGTLTNYTLIILLKNGCLGKFDNRENFLWSLTPRVF